MRGFPRIDPVRQERVRSPSNKAPDSAPFGGVTAYCKIPAKADAENKCPQWVNDSI
jgi:hypothetical protein